MKNKLSLLAIGLPILALGLSFAPAMSLAIRTVDPNSPVDCERYFNDTSYTSLYMINASYNGSSNSYKTWGTVSEIQITARGERRVFIQSTDKYKNKGAICLTGALSDVEVGNVITCEGVVSRNYGLMTMQVESHQIDYYENDSPIIPYEVSSLDFGLSNSYTQRRIYDELYTSGPLFGVAYNMRLDNSMDMSDDEIMAYFPNGDSVTLYINSTDASSVKEHLSSFAGKRFNILGPMQPYENNGGKQFTEFLIDSVDQIVEYTEVDKAIERIEVSKTALSFELSSSSSEVVEVHAYPGNTNKELTFSLSSDVVYVTPYFSEDRIAVLPLKEGMANLKIYDTTDESINALIEIVVRDLGGVTELETISLSMHDAPSEARYYDTGNFASGYHDGYDFEYYRSNYCSDGFITLLDNDQYGYYSPSLLEGAFYNVDPISRLYSINITYRSDTNFYVRYGDDRNYEHEQLIEPSNYKEQEIIFGDGGYKYFAIETNDSDLDILSLDINYIGGYSSSYTYEELPSDNRLEPTLYSKGSFTPGQSSVEVPAEVQYNADGSFVVLRTKTLVFDTFEEARRTGRDDLYAYTDIADVAAYFVAFGTFPCNYYDDDGYYSGSEVSQVMGDKTRRAKQYTRTDGYATSVPYVSCDCDEKRYTHTHYWELDVGLDDSYQYNNRGVGRLVCWRDGFSIYEWENNPVVVYTDDHYATFSEFMNDGTFASPFNAEMNRTPYVYGAPNQIR